MPASPNQDAAGIETGTEQNKATVLRFYDEVWNRGNMAVADEVFTSDSIRNDLRATPIPKGAEGQQMIATLFRSAFPDCLMTVDFMVAEAEMVVARWTITGTNLGPWLGQPPTGKSISFTGVNIFRFAGGMVVENWNYRDDLGLMQQLAEDNAP